MNKKTFKRFDNPKEMEFIITEYVNGGTYKSIAKQIGKSVTYVGVQVIKYGNEVKISQRLFATKRENIINKKYTKDVLALYKTIGTMHGVSRRLRIPPHWVKMILVKNKVKITQQPFKFEYTKAAVDDIVNSYVRGATIYDLAERYDTCVPHMSNYLRRYCKQIGITREELKERRDSRFDDVIIGVYTSKETMTYKQTAKQLSMNRNFVITRLKKNNVPLNEQIRPKREHDDKTIKLAIKMYLNGDYYWDIVQKTGIDFRRLKEIIVEHGYQLRSSWEAHKHVRLPQELVEKILVLNQGGVQSFPISYEIDRSYSTVRRYIKLEHKQKIDKMRQLFGDYVQVTEDKVRNIYRLYDNGVSTAAICRELHVDRNTVKRWVARRPEFESKIEGRVQ